MTERGGFALHPAAARDITEIWEFLAAGSPAAAGHVREELLRAMRRLAEFPDMGVQRPELTSRPLRFLVVRDYLIAYAPKEHPVTVLAVLDARRNPRVLATALRDRE